MNVVSLLIHSRPGWNNQIKDQLSKLAGTEIHACTQDTRWVVTAESDSSDTLAETILQMQNIEGVLSAAVVYSAVDTEDSSGCGTAIKLSRRAFLKASAIASVTALAGVSSSFPVIASNRDMIRWDKAPCRFCGVGCSVLVGVQNGRVVATQGDPESPVNRGLNCIKGYFLSKIMYGDDRLTKPLLRMNDGVYSKTGEFTEITSDNLISGKLR